jgi:hypothetical protein
MKTLAAILTAGLFSAGLLKAQDTTPPTIIIPAQSVTVECDGSDPLPAFYTWLGASGNAYASDDSMVTPLWNSDFAGLPGSDLFTVVVTFTATDFSGNTATTTATYTVQDTVPPAFLTPAQNLTTTITPGGNSPGLNAWLVQNGQAEATDACTPASQLVWTNNFTVLTNGTATVTFTVADAAGNASTTTATVTATEEVCSLVITQCAKNKCVECDGCGNISQLTAWLTDNGGARATSSCCNNLTWTNNFTSLKRASGCGTGSSSGGCNVGQATVTFTVTDCFGNCKTTRATFKVVDTTPPAIDWYVEGNAVPAGDNIHVTRRDLPVSVRVIADDLCSTSYVCLRDRVRGCASLSRICTVTNPQYALAGWNITSMTDNSRVTFYASARDVCGNWACEEYVYVTMDPTSSCWKARGNACVHGDPDNSNTPCAYNSHLKQSCMRPCQSYSHWCN